MSASHNIRPPAVAGPNQFYASNPAQLRAQVRQFLEDAPGQPPGSAKAVIAPHAGYIYSGAVAGTAFAAFRPDAREIRRVVLLGPSHRLFFRGLAVSQATAFATPLGLVPVDAAALELLRGFPQVKTLEAAHAHEHCLEVELPFLQEILGEFTIVPLLVGEATAAEISPVLEALWGGPETRFVVSTDLSHYEDYATAQRLDQATALAIERLECEHIGPDQACGWQPLHGWLHAARQHHLRGCRVDLRNSGDTSGRRDQVVGYGAFVFTAEPVSASRADGSGPTQIDAGD